MIYVLKPLQKALICPNWIIGSAASARDRRKKSLLIMFFKYKIFILKKLELETLKKQSFYFFIFWRWNLFPYFIWGKKKKTLELTINVSNFQTCATFVVYYYCCVALVNFALPESRCLESRCVESRCVESRCSKSRCSESRCSELRCSKSPCAESHCLQSRCSELRCVRAFLSKLWFNKLTLT
jgi:hypothetical protein